MFMKVVGNRGPTEINARSLMMIEASIHGISLWEMENHICPKTKAALDKMNEHNLLNPIISHQYTIDQGSSDRKNG